MSERKLEGKALEMREQSFELLKRDGGFNLVKDIAKDLKYFAPNADEDLKAEFLDPDIEDFDEDRVELQSAVNIMIELLSDSENLGNLNEIATQKVEEAQSLANENLKSIAEKIKPLEKAYRQLDLYFKNIGSSDVKNLVLLNCNHEDLVDKDDEIVNTKVNEVLSDPALAIDQSNVFSFLVIPEFLGEELIQTYTGHAHNSKVMLFTDHKEVSVAKKLVE